MRKENIATELTPLLEHVSSLAAARSELEDVRIGCVNWGEKGVASENPPDGFCIPTGRENSGAK